MLFCKVHEHINLTPNHNFMVGTVLRSQAGYGQNSNLMLFSSPVCSFYVESSLEHQFLVFVSECTQGLWTLRGYENTRGVRAWDRLPLERRLMVAVAATSVLWSFIPRRLCITEPWTVQKALLGQFASTSCLGVMRKKIKLVVSTEPA